MESKKIRAKILMVVYRATFFVLNKFFCGAVGVMQHCATEECSGSLEEVRKG